jgi:transposase, IS5 family
MIDATTEPVPKQRNSREDNEAVKAGKDAGDLLAEPRKNRQKDRDARWTNEA